MKIVPNRIIIFLVVFLVQQATVFAAPSPPPPTTPPPPPGLPLDGGIFLLVLLSVSYGVFKLINIKNIKKASN
ncbi:hypothetical protein [Flavobacterium sp.]|jgi:hypothetical protein|uniref:hypothetical protein n=1 Tax=Flavobacterium sp. TaxID=239 RepID=UPI0037BF7778